VLFRALLWEQVYTALEGVSTKSRIAEELLEFMRHHGLSPGESITDQMITGFAVSRGFLPRLERYAGKLLHESDWSVLPEVHRQMDRVQIKNRWGRIAIEFAPPGWNGAITVGFLHDNYDHQVPFADPNGNGIDVIMRIEAAPSLGDAREQVIDVLRTKIDDVRGAGGVARLLGDTENRNRHSLFIAQRSLSESIAERTNERDQVEAIYQQVKSWSDVLFADGTLGQALNALRH
jgi:hypothetical protein